MRKRFYAFREVEAFVMRRRAINRRWCTRWTGFIRGSVVRRSFVIILFTSKVHSNGFPTRVVRNRAEHPPSLGVDVVIAPSLEKMPRDFLGESLGAQEDLGFRLEHRVIRRAGAECL